MGLDVKRSLLRDCPCSEVSNKFPDESIETVSTFKFFRSRNCWAAPGVAFPFPVFCGIYR